MSKHIDPATKTDANNRAVRTLVQGAITTGIAAASAAAATVIGTWTGNEIVTGVAWSAVGVVAGTAGLNAVVSYIARYVAPPKE